MEAKTDVAGAPLHPIVMASGPELTLPKPYYDQDGITIYHGDCLSVLPVISVDVVITDPPYGLGARDTKNRPSTFDNKGKNKSAKRNTWHVDSEWDDEINPEWCKSVCAASDIVFWFGNWKRRREVEDAMIFPMRCEIIWAKDTHTSAPIPVARRDERIWLFSKSGFKGHHFETTVWDEPIIPTWSHRRHKNEKPMGLMKRLVRFACKNGQLICDPFMGSGTTLEAAKQLGVRAIGIDINEKYCETAAKRLAQGVLF